MLRKILGFQMESYNKNIYSKFGTLPFFFQNVKKKFPKRKKNVKNFYGF